MALLYTAPFIIYVDAWTIHDSEFKGIATSGIILYFATNEQTFHNGTRVNNIILPLSSWQ